jgi:hypothetical protein
MSDATWQGLTDELACWQRVGLQCNFWWRDDDAIAVSHELLRLQSISERYFVDVLVAAIPAAMSLTLGRDALGLHSLIWCQHGLAHVNYEPGGPNSEFPASRDNENIAQDLANGRQLLLDQFGDRLFPVLVPPWNRFREDMIAELPVLGYTGLSQYGDVGTTAVLKLTKADAHLDIVDWTMAPKFPVERPTLLLERLIEGLLSRRHNPALAAAPFGVLTHHRAMDEGSWIFMDKLLEVTHQFPCVEWVSPRDIFREYPV